MFLDPTKFEVVAGAEVVAKINNGYKDIHWTGYGYESEALCAKQRQDAVNGFLGAEIVKSFYGYSLRYDSGLQNFGLIAKAADIGLPSTLEKATKYAKRWASHEPTKRYAWFRKE